MSATKTDSRGPINHQHERALVLLAHGASLREVGEALGVDHTTVWKWTRDPAFSERLETMRGAVTEHTLRDLRTLMPTATRRLSDILHDEEAKHHDVLTAIAMVYDRAGVIKGQALTVRAEQIDDTEVLGELAEAAGVGDVAQGDQEEPA